MILTVCDCTFTVVSATFEEPSVPVTVMEADGAYSSDVCIILDVPAGGVECEFDILLEPMGIDASEYTVIRVYNYVYVPYVFISSGRSPY